MTVTMRMTLGQRGWALLTLVCLASTPYQVVSGSFLRHDDFDALETIFVRSSDNGHTQLFPPLTNRDPERCTEATPCAMCEGDCNMDSECNEGLVCFHRERGENTTVPGCSGGDDDPSRDDYCIRSSAAPPSIVYVRQCNSTHPCDQCQGDCDSDDDCQGNLKCFQRKEGERALVPGCMGGANDPAKTDFCYKKPPDDPRVKITGQCSKKDKCGLCEGDCDEDDECAGDLKCYHRDKGERAKVPGCRKGEKSGSRTDYCYKSCGCCVKVDGDCHEYEEGWESQDCVIGEACLNIFEFELMSGTCDSCDSGISCLDKYGAYDGCPIREYTGTGP